ncbi:MAG: helix-turn-helix domain-containing protein [Egibacteraceae bacterium]
MSAPARDDAPIAAVAEDGHGLHRRDSRVSVERALGSPTRQGIYERLRAEGSPRTVREVAARFGLHPNVARTHLETLADAGLLAVGLRRHPGGGRPAKLYCAVDEDAASPSVPGGGATGLQVRLLAELADPDPPAATDRPAESRAHEVGAVEGRRLVAPLAAERPQPLEATAETVIRALRPHAPQVRVARASAAEVEVTGLAEALGDVAETRPALAEALARGLLEGAFAGAGAPVTAVPGQAPADGEPTVRVRPVEPTGRGRRAPRPAHRVDARGLPREDGVVRAMREVTRLREGEVLEVLAEGPGSPAAFAGWVDRAGHELLGVERAVDRHGRPGIRLLIRKGPGAR